MNHHARRWTPHSNSTGHPTADWVLQQHHETLRGFGRQRHAILDRDAKFSPEVLDFFGSSGIEPVGTSIRSPSQNGLAERWVGSCRRECFDHVIALNEAHLRRLAREYVAYYHQDRTHDALGKDTPDGRQVEPKPTQTAVLVSLPRLGGLQQRYSWKAAA